jgi:RNA polymerase sigma-70 factor (ECF subfamily)
MPPDLTTEPTDAELARRVSTGPDRTRAFEALFARHHARLLAFLLARFPDTAEDVAQEAWLKALAAARAGPRAMTNFRGFLFEVARNLALDLQRRKCTVPFADGAEPQAPDSTALDTLLDTERRNVVRECLKRLHPDQRTVVEAAAGGESAEECAARLGVSHGIIYQRKSRGLSALRECVKRHLP